MELCFELAGRVNSLNHQKKPRCSIAFAKPISLSYYFNGNHVLSDELILGGHASMSSWRKARLRMRAFQKFAARITSFKEFVPPFDLREEELGGLNAPKISLSPQENPEVHPCTVTV